MFTLTAAMLAEVITRYFFGTSLFGLEQHVGYTAVWIYFLGSAYGAYERSHIKAEFTRILFKSHRKFYISKVASGIVAFAMCIVFTDSDAGLLLVGGDRLCSPSQAYHK